MSFVKDAVEMSLPASIIILTKTKKEKVFIKYGTLFLRFLFLHNLRIQRIHKTNATANAIPINIKLIVSKMTLLDDDFLIFVSEINFKKSTIHFV